MTQLTRLVLHARPQDLWKGYAIAMAIVLGLFLTSHTISVRAVHLAKHDVELIDIAVKQHLLSQQILKLSEQLAVNRVKRLELELGAAAHRFETNQRVLTEASQAAGPTHDLYFQMGAALPLDPTIDGLLKNARIVLQGDTDASMAALTRMQVTEKDVNAALNRSLAWFETHAIKHLAFYQDLHKYSFLAACLVLLIQAALVFWPAHVTAVRAIHRLQIQKKHLKAAQRELYSLAYVDQLTGLGNRADCERELSKRIEQFTTGAEFAIVLVDLDNHKRTNDTLGHRSGDALLREAGRRLSILVSDLSDARAFRWAGDEFVIVCATQDDFDLETICHEITDLISAPMAIGESTVWATASVGVAVYPKHGRTADALLNLAYLALNEAKDSGRDGVAFFSREMRQQIDDAAAIEDDLRLALDRNELELFYQPQIDLTDGTVSGLEALIRWRHPDRGLLTPGAFLAVAEQTNQDIGIGRFVVEQALRDTRQLSDTGMTFGRVAINVSPRHLALDTFIDELSAALARHSIEPDQITIECVESVFIDDTRRSHSDTLQLLHNAGIHVELDDFGTGYASLAHLATLPIDGVKIDRSFTQAMQDDERKFEVVKALIGLGRLLQLRLVVEGVETQEQLAMLRGLGPLAIQGFFLARPMSFENLKSWLTSRSTHHLTTQTSGPARMVG